MTIALPTLLPEILVQIAQYSGITVCRTLCRVSTVFNAIIQDPVFANAWEREAYAAINPGPGFELLLDFLLEGKGSWREVFLAYVVVQRSLTTGQSYTESGSFRTSVLKFAKNTVESLILLQGHFSLDIEEQITSLINDMSQSRRRAQHRKTYESLFLNLKMLDIQQKHDPEVCHYLSECYFRGIGTKTKPAKAFFYALVAARKGHEPARCNLGSFYAKGFGVQQNNIVARDWLKPLTTPLAKFFLGKIVKSAGYDFKTGFQLIEEAALGGHIKAQYLAGLYYRNGYGEEDDDSFVTEIDPIKAFHFFELSAHQGHIEALFNLGDCYLQGFGTQKCFDKGFACFKLANRYGYDCYCSSATFFGIESDEDRLKMWQFLEEGFANGDDAADMAIWAISKQSEEWDIRYQALKKMRVV